ncbi:hypothetical protein HIU97_12105 [Enterococcus casseliflavus]|nr:hypothetical protein [Enterococcus casseliflavus]
MEKDFSNLKLIDSDRKNHSGYGAGSGDTERYEYECACGNGKIIEEHDNIPGFRDLSVWLMCENCKNHYKLDTSKGIRNWELVKK